jgi:hypothetical protein
MTLNKFYILIEAAFYAIGVLVALTHLKRIFTEVDSWIPIILYFIQYIWTYMGAAVIITFQLSAHFEQQHLVKVMKKQKTFKGRMKMKLEENGENLLKP